MPSSNGPHTTAFCCFSFPMLNVRNVRIMGRICENGGGLLGDRGYDTFATIEVLVIIML